MTHTEEHIKTCPADDLSGAAAYAAPAQITRAACLAIMEKQA